LNLLGAIACEGRRYGPEPGTCTFAAACLRREAGGLHDFQDCNNDPRDGCEDTSRWCQVGKAATQGPRSTQSDKCSKAMIYYCGSKSTAIPPGFDNWEAPCKNPVTGLYLDFPAPPRSAVECWSLYENSTIYHVNITNFAPYCDRNASHLETRGDCVFECAAPFADCNGLASDGCEANITQDQHCDDACVDCEALSGVDTATPPACVKDISRAGHYLCNFTCAGTRALPVNCMDFDDKWENGCEVATNKDFDREGVFMNEQGAMDCSIMQDEARKNPELFRHHLHIDLTKIVPTTLSSGRSLPAGTIFCDNGLSLLTATDSSAAGKCFFMCIDGFVNADRESYNGCEGISSPYYVHPLTFGTPKGYGGYGGYWIGDPHVEDFLAFFCTASKDLTYNSVVTFPDNTCQWNTRTSALSTLPAGLAIPLWY